MPHTELTFILLFIMKVIKPYCRSQLTLADIDFILSVMRTDRDDLEALVKILAEENTRDLILDDPGLFHAVLESTDHLRISLHLYFYILVRHVLKEAGLDDCELADYVASVMTQFTRHLPGAHAKSREAFFYAVDVLGEIECADFQTRFYLVTSLGNTALILTGVFPDHIEYRARMKAAPNLNYYESIGSAQFQAASSHNLAQTYHLDRIYATLSNSFSSVRSALNEMKERLLFLGNPYTPYNIELQ